MQVGNQTDGAHDHDGPGDPPLARPRRDLLARPDAQRGSRSSGSSSPRRFVWVIALLVTTAQSPTKQGLHDQFAGTIVVKAARSIG